MPSPAKTPRTAAAVADPLERLVRFLDTAEALLARLEPLLPEALPQPDWKAPAYRWRRKNGRGFLQAVAQPHPIR
ncbi:MAG: AAA family ATPase, partial [Azospira sp.]|nr:AAA family ATPase [Azospira sp.]